MHHCHARDVMSMSMATQPTLAENLLCCQVQSLSSDNVHLTEGTARLEQRMRVIQGELVYWQQQCQRTAAHNAELCRRLAAHGPCHRAEGARPIAMPAASCQTVPPYACYGSCTFTNLT